MVLETAGGWGEVWGRVHWGPSLSPLRRPFHHVSRFRNFFGWAGLSDSFAQDRSEVTE